MDNSSAALSSGARERREVEERAVDLDLLHRPGGEVDAHQARRKVRQAEQGRIRDKERRPLGQADLVEGPRRAPSAPSREAPARTTLSSDVAVLIRASPGV
jgi:sRNA-binding protein